MRSFYTRLSLKPSPKLINFSLKKIAICAFESLGHLKKFLDEIINLLNIKDRPSIIGCESIMSLEKM